jgi:hypothetical protein
MKLSTGLAALVLAAGLAAAPASAQNYAGMNPEALQNAAIAAVNGGDQRALMAIMQEMQRRHMFFFEDPERQGCEEVIRELIPDTITGHTFYGTLRSAYMNRAEERRLEEQSCTCAFRGFSLADFTQELLGKDPSELVDGDRPTIAAFMHETYSASDAYRAFYHQTCARRDN